jgi:hypothetical protein
MNRIFELAKQADIIKWDELPYGYRTPDYESVVKAKIFAELIVRECASISENHAGGTIPLNISLAIKEHFKIK